MMVEVGDGVYVNPAHIIRVKKFTNENALHQVNIELSTVDAKGRNEVMKIVFVAGDLAEDLVNRLII